MSFEMDVNMDDVGDAAVSSSCNEDFAHRGRGEMEEGELEEGEIEEGGWTEEPQRIPAFRAFELTTPDAHEKSARLAKIEIWKRKMEKERARKELTRQMEAGSIIQTSRVSATLAPPASPTKAELEAVSRDAQLRANEAKYKVEIIAAKARRELEKQTGISSTQNVSETGTKSLCARGESFTMAAPPPPLSPLELVYNEQRGSMSPNTSNSAGREREQDIDEGMYGNEYGDMHGDPYGDAYWNADVEMYEENFGSGGRPQTKKNNARKRRFRERAAALRVSLQEHRLLPVSPSRRVVQKSPTQTSSARGTPVLNSNSSDKRQKEKGQEAEGKTDGKGSEVIPRAQRQEYIDASRRRIMALQASLQAKGLLPVPPRKLVQENITRPLSTPRTATSNLHSSNMQQEREQEECGETDKKNSGPGIGPQKNLLEQINSSQKRLMIEQSGAQEQELQLHTVLPIQQGIRDTIDNKTHRSNDVPSHEQELQLHTVLPIQQGIRDTIDNKTHRSNDVPSHEQEKRRQILSVPEDIRLLIEGRMERTQKLLTAEEIGLLMENTKSKTSTDIKDALREKINRKKVAVKETVLQEQKFQLHAAHFEHLMQENFIPLHGETLEVSPLEHEQEHLATKEEIVDLFSIPKDIGDILERSSQRIDTEVGDVMEETRWRPDAYIEYPSEETKPRIVPNILSEVFSAPKDTGDEIKISWREMDTEFENPVDETRPKSIISAKDILEAEWIQSPYTYTNTSTSINALPISKQLADFLSMDLRREFANL
ncbi:hypothetical protein NHQ30_003946 [Ciborinia camelliae]|nr:hypothetical protein NHQ30_003946 [Ciborinia camelliae]